jgi:GTP-binding protein
MEFANWLGNHQVPFVIVFTKIDKSKALEINKNIEKFKQTLLETWTELPAVFKTSSEKKTGQRELREFINSLII